VVVGLAILLFGWIAAISAGYASNANFTMESHGGTAVVYAVDEQVQDSEGHPLQVRVFEGSEQEALAYGDAQLTDPDFSGPHAIMIAGVLLVIVAFVPIRMGKPNVSESVTEPTRSCPSARCNELRFRTRVAASSPPAPSVRCDPDTSGW
jgi:hypothetical protein